jgi:hypothetical protein
METVVAELLVEIIGAQSRRIDDPTGGEITAGRVHGGAVGADADSGDVGCGVEVDPAGDRVGGQREVSGPGADDGLVGDGESAQRSVTEVGCLAVNLGGIDDFALRVAIVGRFALQRGQRLPRRGRTPVGSGE